VERLDINPCSAKIEQTTMAVTRLEEFIAHIVASRDM
jgi:hypothetical protein